MKIKYATPDNDIAKVYVAELEDGSSVEFVESVQPPYSRDEKWVLIVSTLKGCPVKCPICDAGGNYRGKLTSEEIMAQIMHMAESRYPDGVIPSKKFKVQFARMGDPALNMNVIDVIEELPDFLKNANIMPCVSTIAPAGTGNFFEKLAELKNRLYTNGRFQMQFSVHTTDEARRRDLIPVNTWSFREIAEYGKRFYREGDRKITLNFATPVGYPLESGMIREYFCPDYFMIKLTPVNPTKISVKSKISGVINPGNSESNNNIAAEFIKLGYQTIISIGELEENRIGSNCGMYIKGDYNTRRN